MINEIDKITRGLSNRELSNVLNYEEYKEILLSLAELKKNNPKGYDDVKNDILMRKKKKDESLRATDGVGEILELEEKARKGM